MNVDQLAKDLLNGSPEQRAAAAQTLMLLGEAAAGAAASLVTLAGDDAAGEWCVATLEALGPPPVDQVDQLAKLTTADCEATAYWAATLLGRLGVEAAAAVPALTDAAQHHSALAAQERSVWALGKIGAAASQATQVLAILARSDQKRLARLAKRSLELIDA